MPPCWRRLPPFPGPLGYLGSSFHQPCEQGEFIYFRGGVTTVRDGVCWRAAAWPSLPGTFLRMGQGPRGSSTLGRTSRWMLWATVSRSAHPTCSWAITSDLLTGLVNGSNHSPTTAAAVGRRALGTSCLTGTKNINRSDTCLHTQQTLSGGRREDTSCSPQTSLTAARAVFHSSKCTTLGSRTAEGAFHAYPRSGCRPHPVTRWLTQTSSSPIK